MTETIRRPPDVRPFRVLQVIETLQVSYGGPARNAFELNRSLNSLPDTVATIVFVDGSYEGSVLAEADRTATTGPDYRAAPRGEIASELHRSDVVVIHGYYWWWTAPLAVLSALRGRPYVVTPHGALERRQRQYSRGKKAVFESVAGSVIRRLSAGFIVGSERERGDLCEVVRTRPVAVGGVGVRLTAAVPSQVPVPSRDDVRLLFLSRLHPKKRPDVAIRAVALLKERGYRCTLTIAGDGRPGFVGGLRRLAADLDLSEEVALVGQVGVEDKATLFGRHHFFVLPSESENFGIAVAEALNHGLPTVTTSDVAAAEGIDPRAGRLISHPDEEHLAAAVASLLDAGGYDDLRKAAIEHARSRFDWTAVAQDWRELLIQLGHTSTRSPAGRGARRGRSPLDHFYPEHGAGGFTRTDGTVEFYTRVNALVSDDSTVLDFGAGRGRFGEDRNATKRNLQLFRERVACTIGVDVDDAVHQNPHLTRAYTIEPGRPLPLASDSVDLVVSDWTFEHVTDPAWAAAELARVVRPGGWICARTPNRWGTVGLPTRLVPNAWHAGILGRLQPSKKVVDTFPTAYRMNSRRQIGALFPAAQFLDCTYVYDSEPSYAANSFLAWSLTRALHRTLPGPLGQTLMIFLRKHP
ncbi:glycosyltransferase [Actinomycetospora sp. OC33-EN08]|uniref:Glycosyltransferase n=1 Tax=Actinomycetospora aurantiaca TaxID=3129233 RepID=A0ABU8MFX7_9PSEU